MTLANLIPGNNLENWKILVSGEDIGAIKGSQVTLRIAEETKFTADVSTQLQKRVAAWTTKEDFGLTATLYEWDHDVLERLALFVQSTTKLRDQIKSQKIPLPVIFQGPLMIGKTTTAVTAETITMSGSGTDRTFQLAHGRIVPGGLSFGDGVETFTDDELGRLTGSAGGSGWYNTVTGYGEVTWNANPGAVTDGAYSYLTDSQIEIRFPEAIISKGGDAVFDASADGTGIPILIDGLAASQAYSVEIEPVAVT